MLEFEIMKTIAERIRDGKGITSIKKGGEGVYTIVLDPPVTMHLGGNETPSPLPVLKVTKKGNWVEFSNPCNTDSLSTNGAPLVGEIIKAYKDREDDADKA